MSMKQSKRRRIKRDELVRFLFAVFSQRYERTSVDSIHDIRIPVSELRQKLSETYETTYQNDWWIVTQIHRYERETGTHLFERVDNGEDPDSIVLAIYREVDSFHQAHHLLANQKIRIASGVLDLIRNIEIDASAPVSLYLGSGSLPATVAEALVHKATAEAGMYHVYSHNLAVQEKIRSALPTVGSVEFYAVGGRVDWMRYIALTENTEALADLPVDYVIQSTNTVTDGGLYVSNSKEAAIKEAILYDVPGTKVLALIKDEFTRSSVGKHRYGRLCDYDYVVTIPSKNGTTRLADRFFADRGDQFRQLVSHWSYTVYRVTGAPKQDVHPSIRTTRKPAGSFAGIS
jgi:DeoR/GlpR family transcriptional regulator of sugar metabolism